VSFDQEREQWFAVQVRSRRERSTATLLDGKGYRTMLPTYSTTQRVGKGQENLSPLFPGYVFCRFDSQKRLPVLITPGVIALVGRGRVPVPVDPSEISAIESMVSSGMPLAPWPYLELGQRVRIEHHALAGVEGILIGFKGGHRIVVSVSILRRSVALEVDEARVRPVEPKRDEVLGLVPSCALAIA
jgi:transcriptional antiterminator NusG